jgi:hypothetical protein
MKASSSTGKWDSWLLRPQGSWINTKNTIMRKVSADKGTVRMYSIKFFDTFLRRPQELEMRKEWLLKVPTPPLTNVFSLWCRA